MRDPLAWIPIRYKLPLTFAFLCLVALVLGGEQVDLSDLADEYKSLRASTERGEETEGTLNGLKRRMASISPVSATTRVIVRS